MSTSRGPYNLPSGGGDVDSMAYNPQADARMDNAAFDENADPEMQPVGVRGTNSQQTARDFEQEDRETGRSEQIGQIPRRAHHPLTVVWHPCTDVLVEYVPGEVDDLLSSSTADERDVSGYTRGRNVDAYKQERNIDRAFDDAGLLDGSEDN